MRTVLPLPLPACGLGAVALLFLAPCPELGDILVPLDLGDLERDPPGLGDDPRFPEGLWIRTFLDPPGVWDLDLDLDLSPPLLGPFPRVRSRPRVVC
jgi:hypothetical protein